jgi:hypothetical protein
MDDRIITHAMLEAEMMDKIEQLEADLAAAQADHERELTLILADNLDHQALLLDAEGKIERLMAERDAAVARLRYLYDDLMSKLIWHDKPPISFDQYAFNIDAARKEGEK